MTIRRGKEPILPAVHRLPAVVTTFALGAPYLRAVEGLLGSVREIHPGWVTVAGRCLPPPGGGVIDLDVELGGAAERWQAPVRLDLDGGAEDWRRVTRLKAWWIAEVWRRVACEEGRVVRLLWLDVEVRLRQPLAFALDPLAETIAGPWWQDPEGLGRDTITSGVLLLQGLPAGPVARILEAWSSRCLREIEALPPRTLPWRDGDQEVLNELLQEELGDDSGFQILKLPHEDYCAGRSGLAAGAATVAEHGAVHS